MALDIRAPESVCKKPKTLAGGQTGGCPRGGASRMGLPAARNKSAHSQGQGGASGQTQRTLRAQRGRSRAPERPEPGGAVFLLAHAAPSASAWASACFSFCRSLASLSRAPCTTTRGTGHRSLHGLSSEDPEAREPGRAPKGRLRSGAPACRRRLWPGREGERAITGDLRQV